MPFDQPTYHPKFKNPLKSQELLRWIEELEVRNPHAAEDGFIKGLYAFPND